MDVIAIVAQKGGTGKTTLAVSLAVAGERDGCTGAIVDLDPQASASNWGDRREADSPVVVSAQPARLGYVLGAAKEQGAELLLIDTPPRAEQAAMAAVKRPNSSSSHAALQSMTLRRSPRPLNSSGSLAISPSPSCSTACPRAAQSVSRRQRFLNPWAFRCVRRPLATALRSTMPVRLV